MRDYLKIYVNGNFYKVEKESAFLSLSEYIRESLFLKGTKEVCKEGDCGACTVLLGKLENNKIKYMPVNSCICYLYQLDGCHIITIEGLKDNEKLNPVQEAMIEHHGSQCGYCTPGMVVSMYSLFDCACQDKQVEKSDIKTALTGNLCRCTGYDSIIKAGLSVDQNLVKKLNELYPIDQLNNIIESKNTETIRIKLDNREFIQPLTLKEALQLKQEYPNAVLLSGGTDIHVVCNKKDFEPEILINLSNLTELNNIYTDENHLIIGSTATLASIESHIADLYSEFHKLLQVYASPQIKNIATLAGNIANGSPVGDSIPFLMIMNAKIGISDINSSREIDINSFYKGYKTFDLKPNEIITYIKIPILEPNEVLRLYKVSKRKHLDISAFSAAIKMKTNNDIIESIAVAFGGVGPTVQRLSNIEDYLCGKKIKYEIFEQAAKLIDKEIKPISDVRGSDIFRLQLAKNCLEKFFYEIENKL